jgi:uncharacterized protein YrzB (UPF0473 family)
MEDKECEIITLTDEEGNEHELLIVDKIVVNETEYLALVPAQECEDDGLYIYKVIVEDGEEYIEPIEDDKEFEEISETFEDRLSEAYDLIEED